MLKPTTPPPMDFPVQRSHNSQPKEQGKSVVRAIYKEVSAVGLTVRATAAGGFAAGGLAAGGLARADWPRAARVIFLLMEAVGFY